MEKKVFLPNRRQVIKAGLIAGAGMMMPWRFLPPKAFANPAATGLSDPALQPKFVNLVPDALDPGFKYIKSMGKYKVKVGATQQWTGLVDSSGSPLMTNLWGYGDANAPGPTQITWPGGKKKRDRPDDRGSRGIAYPGRRLPEGGSLSGS